jgi:hypothetical protein
MMQIQKGNFTWNGKLSPIPKEKFDSIALHHMAHPDADEYEVERWHKGNGWVGIGYNYWIGLDGRIIEGRGLNQGAGVENHNSHIISIGFQGNYEPFSPNIKYLTEMPQAQFEAGVWLIGHLKEVLPNLKYIDGHCRWNPTSCPGRYFPLKKMIDAAEKAEPQEPYYDIKGHWAESIIRQAITEGWVKGYPDGTFRPDAPMTRAESVALVMAAMKKAPG